MKTLHKFICIVLISKIKPATGKKKLIYLSLQIFQTPKKWTIDRNINFHRITLASNYSLSKKCNALPTDTVINTYTSTYIHLDGDWTFMFFVVFTSNKIPFWNLLYFTLYLNDSTHHIYITITLTYPLSIERKNYVRFTVSLKITLFSFERCLPTDKKTKSVKKLKQ